MVNTSLERNQRLLYYHHPEVSQNVTPSLLLDLKCSYSENIFRTSSIYICTRTLSQFSAHSSRIGNCRAEVTRFSRPPHCHPTPHHFSVRASGTKSSLNSGTEQIFISHTQAVSTVCTPECTDDGKSNHLKLKQRRAPFEYDRLS